MVITKTNTNNIPLETQGAIRSTRSLVIFLMTLHGLAALMCIVVFAIYPSGGVGISILFNLLWSLLYVLILNKMSKYHDNAIIVAKWMSHTISLSIVYIPTLIGILALIRFNRNHSKVTEFIENGRATIDDKDWRKKRLYLSDRSSDVIAVVAGIVLPILILTPIISTYLDVKSRVSTGILQQYVDEIKSETKLPHKIDDTMNLVDIRTTNGDTLQFVYEDGVYNPSGQDKDLARNKVVDSTCGGALRQLLDSGYNVRYTYNFTGSNDKYDFRVSSKDCSN